MDSLYEKIASAQNGNEPAMLELLEQFSPLLRKFAFLLRTEDALNELTADFIELIKTLNLNSLRSYNDGVLVNYISNAVRYKYISRSKQQHMDNQMLYWDDFEEPVQRKFEPRCELYSDEEEFFRAIPVGVLSEPEFNIIVMIYLQGYSAADIARTKHITRQAVNQIKRRALKKLYKAICREQKTDDNE